MSELERWAREIEGSPWEWGSTDCASVVRRGLRVVLGRDLEPELPAWASRRQAARLHHATGGVEAVLAAHGFRPLQISRAEPGDVLCGRLPMQCGFPSAGIVLAHGRFLTSDPDRGVIRVPLRATRGPVEVWRAP